VGIQTPLKVKLAAFHTHPEVRLKSRSQPHSRNQLRIIGGKWRGRKLDFPDADGLRPSGDRIRETLFNWLMADVPDSHCLDLFAGSGALGFEAVSRGASRAVLLDNNRTVVEQLRRNCAILDTDQVSVIHTDAGQWLQKADGAQPFTLVFIDPPFNAELLNPIIAQLEVSGALADEALIYLEAEAQQAVMPPPYWQLLKHKQAGRVSFRLYRRQSEDNC